MDKQHFDFWYAVNNTEVLRLPRSRLETFGSSVVNYHLLTEMMDSTAKVRVREGRIEAYKPEIITPQHFTQALLEGFGDEAGRYAEWLRAHGEDLYILQYGFAIRKKEINDHIVSESLPTVISQVQEEFLRKDDPLGALIVGVEEPWEVCLVKLMVEVVQQSAPRNVQDLRSDPDGSRHVVEKLFRSASQDKSLIPALHRLLEERQLFEQYQDRFFALVRRSGA